jgi:hypothetical protein
VLFIYEKNKGGTKMELKEFAQKFIEAEDETAVVVHDCYQVIPAPDAPGPTAVVSRTQPPA